MNKERIPIEFDTSFVPIQPVPKQAPVREKRDGPFKRDELEPDVRDYADSIHGQIKNFFAGYSVTTDEEFQKAVREGKIPLDELEEANRKIEELKAVLWTGELPEEVKEARKKAAKSKFSDINFNDLHELMENISRPKFHKKSIVNKILDPKIIQNDERFNFSFKKNRQENCPLNIQENKEQSISRDKLERIKKMLPDIKMPSDKSFDSNKQKIKIDYTEEEDKNS